jgi:7,8-dihydro-6-hydroxymethylpterin-pyrophosphokinase
VAIGANLASARFGAPPGSFAAALDLRGAGGLEVPHPRLSERAFVLLPWAELSPEWRHPLSGLTVTEMIARLPPGQEIEVLGG